MKKVQFIILIFICACNLSLYGQAKKDAGVPGKTIALVFNLGDLPFAVNAYNDGGGSEAGLGIKYWLFNNLALRGLLMLNLQTQADTFSSRMGIGAAGEFHLLPGDVSPYLGCMLGIYTEPVPGGTAMNFYFGGILGAEAKVWNYLSIYAEYSLLFTFMQDSFEMNLGMGNSSQVGLLFYIK